MLTSSWPGMLDYMTLAVALIAIMSVTCIIIALVTIKFIYAFISEYLKRVRSVRSNIASISEYLDA